MVSHGEFIEGQAQTQADHNREVLPIERIIMLFRERFDEPYLNPSAELTLREFTTAFPKISDDTLEAALSYWTNHSGMKVLQTKVVVVGDKDTQVWYVHGLGEREPELGSEPSSLPSTIN